MGKGKDFRSPRRRGFDDDFFFGGGGDAPPPARPRYTAAPMQPDRAATGPVVDANVKWFNPEKGFGFVELSDGSGDAFLHAAVLERAGHSAVAPGAKLKARVGQGQKGPQITEVVEVDMSTAQAAPAGGSGGGGGFGGAPRRAGPRPPRFTPDMNDAIEMLGTVKWYNPAKGFGFVAVEDGAKDVFVHASVLERAGILGLNEGQSVRMQVVQSPKGREAATISLV
jgi:CspA family cold shock protein